MSARNLAALIESYLEDDGTSDSGSNGSVPAAVPSDSAVRQQLAALAQKTDKLQQDIAALKNNLQMTAILPLLTSQSLNVVSDSAGTLIPGETIDFQQADPLSTLLPVLLMGGLGDSSNGSDNTGNMLLLVLALAGKL